MGTAIKHPVPDRVKPSFVIFDIRTLWLMTERQSARMSKITNDRLTRSGTHRMLYSCTHMATVGVKGLKLVTFFRREVYLRLIRLFCYAVHKQCYYYTCVFEYECLSVCVCGVV